MIRRIPLFLLCTMLTSFSVYGTAKYQKHTKLELLKEVIGRYFSEVTNVRDRPTPKVSFAAVLTQRLSNVNAMVIKFDSVLTNEGNAFDKTTGTFTAPMNGMYLFSWNVMSYAGKKAHAYLYVNNNAKWLSYADNGPQEYDTGSGTVSLRLKQGDKVEIRAAETNNYILNAYIQFTGTLLYR